ncbi:type II toxin-antitoxin system VapC family toxin [Microbacterium sp. CR_7]|uniref:type II toxin-antitoxin system VapC family toxin n=1 Tax=Microbacterium sp. CR_7 TaxID=3055792 RepID=UPI0035C1E668
MARVIALLDTDILIASRAEGEAPADLSEFEDLRVSTLSWVELAKGLHTTQDLQVFKQRSARLAALRTTFGDGIPFDDDCADAYDRVLAHLSAQGVPVRPHMSDRMLAATALAHGLTLVSRDSDAFLGLTDLITVVRR